MTETITTTHDALLADYLAFWNATEPEERARIGGRTFTEDVTYVDPQASVAGRDALSHLVGAVQGELPGMTFTPGDLLDGHHHVLRFRWHLGPAEAPELIVGFDVVTTDDEGRVTSVVGFLDKVPQG